MKRVTLTLAALGVLSVAAGQAMAAGIAVRSSHGIPILGHAPAPVTAYAAGHGHSVHRCPPGCHCPRCSAHATARYPSYHHGPSRYGYPVYPPIVVRPGVYGAYPYYGYSMPYRGFTYNSRGLSLSFGY